ncbi:beta-ketoacyl synthase chain length factor [Carboxylicivirga sp. A043]|uniref:beta-ketoacyl synthase chain length factor n=1 Tax=Carboxylicivirga litoralis TaxID=2816963 RepID=UPI0021CAFA86|nr:beta-ketoacyl synthase chain length factor [Carboxylicivirga sp. A043]MCU4155833.1 beta-ketoacyl synthase chain length factor [Carboxylicivirga sp. A043]
MYIIKTSCISPQKTHDGSYANDIISYNGNKYNAIEPDYKGLIRPAQLRRMGKTIRMGIGAGLPILQDIERVDGIILASSEGGLEDCIKFLNQIVDYDEGSLTPTNFVQSTPNALAGNLALMSKCQAYNMTHVHRGGAMENALLDALLLFEEKKADLLLLGNVEEISDYNFNIETLAGQFKKEEVTSDALLNSQTPGTVCGEGSSMFLLSNNPDNALAEIMDVAQVSFPHKEDILDFIIGFLSRNLLSPEDIDTIIIGKNGDVRTDFWYDYVCDELFQSQNQYSFKNIVGEYPTSIAFATHFACELLAGKDAPEETIIREINAPKNILIYNHFKGEQHGVILIRK